MNPTAPDTERHEFERFGKGGSGTCLKCGQPRDAAIHQLADAVRGVQGEEAISFTALLSVLNRLKSKNRNPERRWYLGWNAALDCLINDINARNSQHPLDCKCNVCKLLAPPSEGEEALKPCPFCSSPASIWKPLDKWMLGCSEKDCVGAFIDVSSCPDREWIVTRWNMREKQ